MEVVVRVAAGVDGSQACGPADDGEGGGGDGGAGRPHPGRLTPAAIFPTPGLTPPPGAAHGGKGCPHPGPHCEAPVTPEGGGPWGYHLGPMMLVVDGTRATNRVRL